MKTRISRILLFSAMIFILFFVILFTSGIYRYIFLFVVIIIFIITMVFLHHRNKSKLCLLDCCAYLNLYHDLCMYYDGRDKIAENFSSANIDENIDSITNNIILTERILIMLYENYFEAYEKTLKRYLPLCNFEEIKLIYKEASMLLQEETYFSSFNQ